MHLLAADFERGEQVFIRRVRVNAELGKVAQKTFAGVARTELERLFRALKQGLGFIPKVF